MILIADGGSTKCDWILMDDLGEVIFKTRTEGLNPAVFSKSLLEARLQDNAELASYRTKVDMVHFYGAGCGTDKPTEMLTKIFEDYFSEEKEDQILIQKESQTMKLCVFVIVL